MKTRLTAMYQPRTADIVTEPHRAVRLISHHEPAKMCLLADSAPDRAENRIEKERTEMFEQLLECIPLVRELLKSLVEERREEEMWDEEHSMRWRYEVESYDAVFEPSFIDEERLVIIYPREHIPTKDNRVCSMSECVGVGRSTRAPYAIPVR